MILTVWDKGQKRQIAASEGQTVLQALQNAGIYVEASCGGGGTCGKCLVQINKVPRLACSASAADGMEIITEHSQHGEDFSIVNISADRGAVTDGATYGLAVDIGTTTIAFTLVNLDNGKPVLSHGVINSQRALGADVISRIKAADEGKLDILNRYVLDDICRGISYICKEILALTKFNLADINLRDFKLNQHISKMVIAGNTTMLHILMGESCNSLGQYPFTPVFIDLQRHSFEKIFSAAAKSYVSDWLPSCEVLLPPGISTYVGADVAAGILYGYYLEKESFRDGLKNGFEEGLKNSCGMGSKDELEKSLNLLVDLGTNGELALFSKDAVTATATAAGPAFEAGNISCGTGSVPGAIAKAVYRPETESFEWETIGGIRGSVCDDMGDDGHDYTWNGTGSSVELSVSGAPIGICGSGVLDIAAQLVLHGFIDESGYLEEDAVIAPGITFTQKDVRELQLAKSAVRAGIEVLLSDFGASYDDIDKVYLAGGFGHTLNLESAVILGILPEAWRHKVKAIGNSSLAGCVRVLTDAAALDSIVDFTSKAKEINLSAHPRFNDLFMEHMMFENTGVGEYKV